MKINLLSKAVKAALFSSAALMVLAPSTYAQEDDAQVEEIVVTGTRISQSNLSSITPVNAIDVEEIEFSGAINVSELVRAIPAAGVPGFTSQNSNFNVATSGINTVELRNLGEDRTLVVINGRRVVGGIPGTQIVDFNTIPTDFIERIDVVTGGASAVYGSDALAGVVNVVLKKDFEGLQVTGQGGVSDAGDDETYKVATTAGFTFAEGKGNAMISATLDKENGVFAVIEVIKAVDGANLAFFTGDANDYTQDVIPFFSSFSELGRIIVPNGALDAMGNLVVPPAGQVRADQNYVTEANGNVTPFVSAQHGFNRQAFRALSLPTERRSFAAVTNFQVNDNINYFLEGTYSTTETNSSLEPFPLSSDDIYGDSAAQCFDTTNDGVNDSCMTGVSILNPFVPADLAQAARDANPGIADDQLVLGFARRMTELGQRGADNLRQTFRLVQGLEGTLWDTDYNYELSYNFGRTTQDQKSSGQINVLNMRNSLDAITLNGEIVCRDEIARAQGCLPVNIFGQGAINAGLSGEEQRQLQRYLRAQSSRTAQIEQQVFNGFVSGPMFALPGGDAEFVTGFEYRDESAQAIADGLSQQGLNAGNISPPTIGRFHVKEFFAEAQLPLVADKQWAKSLDVNLAARLSNYSTVGNTSALAGSVRWAPTDDILVRAQYAKAVRAPNISELFAGLAETFPAVTDPCENVTTSGGQAAFLDNMGAVDPGTIGDARATTCLQDPAIAARVARDGAFVLTQPERQGVGGFNGGAIVGGMDLQEEEATTYTAGVTWDPQFSDWVAPLTVSLDYYNIEIEQGIGGIARADSLRECYGEDGFNPTTAFCQNIIRFTSGPSVGALRFINAFQQNLSVLTSEGVDLQLGYDFDLGQYGELGTNFTYTRLFELGTSSLPGEPLIDDAGFLGAADNKGLLNLNYSNGPWGVSMTTQWIGKSKLARSGTFAGPSISDKFFVDTQIRYDLSEDYDVYFGVDNLFDEYVPIGQFGPGTSTGWNTAPDVYDGLGTRYYLGFQANF